MYLKEVNYTKEEQAGLWIQAALLGNGHGRDSDAQLCAQCAVQAHHAPCSQASATSTC